MTRYQDDVDGLAIPGGLEKSRDIKADGRNVYKTRPIESQGEFCNFVKQRRLT